MTISRLFDEFYVFDYVTANLAVGELERQVDMAYMNRSTARCIRKYKQVSLMFTELRSYIGALTSYNSFVFDSQSYLISCTTMGEHI